MKYPEIERIERNPNLEGMFCCEQNLIYSEATGEALKMTLILPWALNEAGIAKPRLPLLVFVQGSGWTTPGLDFELPQLARFAHAGFVVATVGHRDYTKGHPFPAYLQDVKCAIRFLRKNAEKYGIDPERVAIWGTSSGGNTALLVGLTADDPRYETVEHAGYSDRVDAVVSCFGPTDVKEIMEQAPPLPEYEAMARGLSGGTKREEWLQTGQLMSPFYQVEEGKEYPSFFLLHGTDDELVVFSQMVKMYHRLLDCGADVRALQVDGAKHEGDFWSWEVMDRIRQFLVEKAACPKA